MKKIFKAISALTLGLIFVSSCSVDNVNETYSPTKDEVSFVQTISVNREIASQDVTYDIIIGRSSFDKDLTVSLSSDFTEGVVCPPSVTFKKGEGSAVISLDISGMEVSKQYKGKVSIADPTLINEKISITSITLTLQKAYTWVSLGEGEWFDNLALMTETSFGIRKVEVLKAEGFDRYRIMNPYNDASIAAAGWVVGGARNSSIEFWVLENGQNVAWDGWWCPGILYDGAGTDIKAYYPSALNSTLAAEDAKSRFFEEKVIGFYPYWYIDGLGGFGTKYPCFLSLPGGPALEGWL